MRERYFGSYPRWPDDSRYSGLTEYRESHVAYPHPPSVPREEIPDSEVIDRYVSPFSLRMDDGTARDMNNMEMSQLLAEKRRLAMERMESDGCCGEVGHEGRCYGCGGWCPAMEQARHAETFCVAFVNWLIPKEETNVIDIDGNQVASGWRIAGESIGSKANYDPADDLG